ncbi:hypothetical protein E2C01_043580 [Portunus trituberculatus]|uniref:Uncharacterized protein n=1 Tax=Portunus trituberculatus TaxID=210409 RepID=A0A5B7FWH1_PORTR|nr:hypothetical protein [Portunus trituberculatus]
MRSLASGEDVTSMACNGCGEEAWCRGGVRPELATQLQVQGERQPLVEESLHNFLLTYSDGLRWPGWREVCPYAAMRMSFGVEACRTGEDGPAGGEVIGYDFGPDSPYAVPGRRPSRRVPSGSRGPKQPSGVSSRKWAAGLPRTSPPCLRAFAWPLFPTVVTMHAMTCSMEAQACPWWSVIGECGGRYGKHLVTFRCVANVIPTDEDKTARYTLYISLLPPSLRCLSVHHVTGGG